jgi:hypothetical protein
MGQQEQLQHQGGTGARATEQCCNRTVIAMGKWGMGGDVYVVLQRKTSTIVVDETMQNVWTAIIRDVLRSNKTCMICSRIVFGVSELYSKVELVNAFRINSSLKWSKLYSNRVSNIISECSESLIVHGLGTLFLKWKRAVLCLFAELYRAGKDLPDPAKLLGGLDVKKPREEWPRYDDDGIGRVDYLRETKEHQELLYHFLRMVLLHDQYKRSKSKQLLSDYCHFSLEAYIVLSYYNGYECWKTEVDL